MNILATLFGGGVAEPIEAIGNVFDKLFTSDEEKMKAEAVLTKLAQHPNELQIELNKIEASHRSTFVAGWRPFIGWVCGVGLGFTFIINPLIQWWMDKPGPAMPVDIMAELVMAMLGLGALRTVEKLQGRAK